MTHLTKNEKYAFLHIPKTAGTSFLHALCEVFPQTSPPFAADQPTVSTAAHLQQYDVVAGHLSFDDYRKYFPAHRPLTILRDPVQRCLSWYWYAREIVPSSVMTEEVQSAKKMHVADFFSQDANVIRRNVVNRQMRQLGGHALVYSENEAATLASAKKNLDAMLWIGDVDSLSIDLRTLRGIAGFECFPDLPRLNAGRPRDSISAALRSKIEQMNWADMELYEHYLMTKPRPCA